MGKKKVVKAEELTIRQCANIRSRKHPDVRCKSAATDGEFCARHSKNPTRFQQKLPEITSNLVLLNQKAKKIQNWWKLYVGFYRFKKQGPGVCIPSEAQNQTDIYTLDATSSIPNVYRWTYADSRGCIWFFDIRSLSMTHAEDSRETLLNPYTREPLGKKAEQSFQTRCKWLRDRKYCLVHMAETELTPEQVWHQNVLDVTMKYDVLGYHTCLNWFEELSIQQLYSFYSELWQLWMFRLDLSNEIKELVVPKWSASDRLLFKWMPSELRFRPEKKWWQRVILDILNRFVSSAQLKEHKILGALYGMTAFAIVSPRVRYHYPWLVEMEEATTG